MTVLEPSLDRVRKRNVKLRGLRLLLMIAAVTISCVSCDPLHIVRYSVVTEPGVPLEHGQVVQVDQEKQVARVYEVVAEVALRYGLERCDGKCIWISCDKFKEKACKGFYAPAGVQGYGAPEMLIYRQDGAHVIIQISYFVGPTEPFRNFERDLRKTIQDELGIPVTHAYSSLF